MPPPSPRSAYIHVPFCKHRCGYCDFAIITGRDDLIDQYLGALSLELARLGEPREVDSLYFGGGTPSHLDANRLDALCQLATERFLLAPNHEWTVEANPESLTPPGLETLVRRGVNRISLGSQSLNDEKLRALDRAHTRADVETLARQIKEVGQSLSLDLMFAAPGETLEAWRRDLNDALTLGPDHISTYCLTYEQRTAFHASRERGELRELDEELQRTMYAAAIDAITAAGYEHYEVSNFARPGRRSRHNEVYWAGDEYYAAGPGAARYVAGVRETNVRSTIAWMKLLAEGQSPVADREELSPEAKARERLVFGLRRMRGVEKGAFAAQTGYEIDALAGEAIARYVAQGLLEDEADRVRLTREGLFVSDALWPSLL